MSEKVVYEYDNNKRITVILFNGTPIIEDNLGFRKSHYFLDFDKGVITTDFKNELLDLFAVSNVTDLKNKINDKVALEFKSGLGDNEFNLKDSKVIIYTKSFENNVVIPATKVRRAKKVIKDLSNGNTVVGSHYVESLRILKENIENAEFTKKDLKDIAKMIPGLIKDGKIKISLDDLTDINKERITEIVSIGKGLLIKDPKALKNLGIDRKHLGSEFAWQKYFEKYGTYLLFGSIEVEPEATIGNDNTTREKTSSVDILTLNRYGFIDVVELKKSSEFLFKLDQSHDNFVPRSSLSTAISQINNYLMTLPYSEEQKGYLDGAESATGLLIIGSSSTLMEKSKIEKYAKANNVSLDKVNKKLRRALRDLNYSFSHIQIVLYDELLDNFEEFINNMKIKVD